MEEIETKDTQQPEVSAEEQQVEPQNTTEQPEAPQEVSQAELNHRALRKLKEAAEKERDEFRQQLEDMQRRQQTIQDQPQQKEEPKDFLIDPDDIVEGKHLSAVDRKVKKLEEQLRSYQQQSSVATIETRLKTEHQDFDQVVTQENIEILRTAYPELATAIASSSDLFSKGKAAYTLIKKFGIHQTGMHAPNVDKVKQNLAKPVPTSSLAPQSGESPLTKANAFAEGLTPDLKKKLYREMIESAKEY